MAATSFVAISQNSNDAEFRSWGGQLSAALAACGLTQAADTGQINWATVTSPLGTNASAGYEIWRFSDALQATNPVFIKLEYGTGASSTARQAMWVQVGTGSNGAGSLTGQLSARVQIAAVGNAASNATSYVSAANNRLAFCLGASLQSAITVGMVSIERTKNAAGADNTDGISMFMSSSNGSGCYDQLIPFTGTIPPSDGFPSCALPGSTTGIAGTDTGIYPHFPANGKLLNAEINHFTYKRADIAAFTQFPVTMYGTTRTYIALGGAATGVSTSPRQSTNDGIAMRYD